MGDGKMGRKFWGPPFWDVLHCSAAMYCGTSESARGFIDLLSAYTRLLPCKECRTHFIKNMNEDPVDQYMIDNHSLFFWTYLIHDKVNQQYNLHHPNEKKMSPPYEATKAKYFLPLGLECNS